jgi:hypothetical protein
MSVETSIAWLIGQARQISGVKQAPATPTERAGAYPFVIAYEDEGEIANWQAGRADDVFTVFVEFHVARKLLQEDITQAMALRDPFLSAVLADPTLGGSVELVQSIYRKFGYLEYGSVRTIGYRFALRCKRLMN